MARRLTQWSYCQFPSVDIANSSGAALDSCCVEGGGVVTSSINGSGHVETIVEEGFANAFNFSYLLSVCHVNKVLVSTSCDNMLL